MTMNIYQNETCPHSCCVPIDDIRIYNIRDSSFELSCPDCVPKAMTKFLQTLFLTRDPQALARDKDCTTILDSHPRKPLQITNNVPVGAGALHYIPPTVKIIIHGHSSASVGIMLR